MNNLNQIIVEGEIHSKTVSEEITALVIETTRVVTTENKETKEFTYKFPVVCFGQMAENLKNFGDLGQGIRLVGRLQEEDSKISIVAEHIELKQLLGLN